MKKFCYNSYLYIAFTVILTLGHIVFADDQDAKLFEISHQAIAHTKLLNTIEFHFSTNIPNIGVDNGHCFVSNNRFFSRLTPERSDIEIKPSESAYNGNKFQLLNIIEGGMGEYLSISSTQILPTSTGTLDPLCLPYFWLFTSGESPQWSMTKDESLWNKVFAQSQYLGQESVQGKTCDVVRMPGVFPNTVNIVYFAVDLNYFPLKTITKDSNEIETGSVYTVSYKVFDVDEEKLIIPMEVEFDQKSNSDLLKGVSIIDPGTLRVNDRIDDDIFTISPTRARRIIDLDVQNSKNKYSSIKQNNKNTHTSLYITKSIFICIGLVIIAASLYVKTRT